jgi:hypothetical protein
MSKGTACRSISSAVPNQAWNHAARRWESLGEPGCPRDRGARDLQAPVQVADPEILGELVRIPGVLREMARDPRGVLLKG